MSDHKRHSTITPAPIPREKTATIGDAMELDSQHAFECSMDRQKECLRRDLERADKDGIFWARIVAAEATLKSIRDGLNFAKWSIPVMLTVLIAVGGVLIKYAVVGAITIELDKRIPPGARLSAEHERPAARYAQVRTP